MNDEPRLSREQAEAVRADSESVTIFYGGDIHAMPMPSGWESWLARDWRRWLAEFVRQSYLLGDPDGLIAFIVESEEMGHPATMGLESPDQAKHIEQVFSSAWLRGEEELPPLARESGFVLPDGGD